MNRKTYYYPNYTILPPSMKKIPTIGIISIIILTAFSCQISADEEDNNVITVTYSFDNPLVENIALDNVTFNKIMMKDTPLGGNLGEPALPERGAYILIPSGRNVEEITVIPSEKVYLGSDYYIEPVENSVSLSDPKSGSTTALNEEIYSSSHPYPGELFTKIGVYTFRGYRILVLKLHPMQYIPTTGELFYYTDMVVSIKTVRDTSPNTLYRGLEKDKIEVIKKVDNPGVANTYQQSPSTALESYDLLILTTDELKESFEPLKEAHDASGTRTIIKTLSDIGSSKPEDIRTYIKNAYTNWGIDYVLLGGDDDVIPAKQLYFGINTAGKYGPDDELGPSDLYYSCLDGAWNNPEVSYPTDKDLSIEDPGVSGSAEGFLVGPYLDSTESLIGTNAMVCKLVHNKQIYGFCNLIFNPPLNLSQVQWLHFSIKKSSLFNNIKTKPFLGSISIHNDNTSINDMIKSEYGIDRTFRSNHILLSSLNGSNTFDWNNITSINFQIYWVKRYGLGLPLFYNRLSARQRIGEKIIIDGLYFSDNREDCWGEPNESDLLAEVNVGRACVGTTEEVDRFVHKTLAYMATDENDNYLKNVLLVGQYLGEIPFGENGKWGGNHLDELIDGCSNANYSTVGFPSDKYVITKLYDRDWKDNGWLNPEKFQRLGGWPKIKLIEQINEKTPHIICNVGHGNQNTSMKLKNQDIDRMSNQNYFFVYSCGCLCGAFDGNDDCIAEYLTVKTDHAAFAVIMNARFGFGKPNSTDSSSQRYLREFWDAVFGENITVISKANQDSKEDNLWRIDEPYMRWCYYELNYFGDPCIALKI